MPPQSPLTERCRAPLAAALALSLVAATPGPLLAKWTAVVEFEPEAATVGKTVELVATIGIIGHLEMPTPSDVESARFQLRSPDGRSIVVRAVETGPPAGRYGAEVTLTQAGEWLIEIDFTIDGEPMSHAAFPDQDPHVLTVSEATLDVLPDTASPAVRVAPGETKDG